MTALANYLISYDRWNEFIEESQFIYGHIGLMIAQELRKEYNAKNLGIDKAKIFDLILLLLSKVSHEYVR